MDKKKLLIIGGIALGVIVLVIVGIIIFKKPKVEEEKPKEEEKQLEVKKYELQTHEYFEKAPEETKYIISSVDELNVFYYLYSDVLNIKEKELKDYTMFVEVKQVGSGSDTYKILKVDISGKVSFLVDESIPEVGTDDMAFWYLVAMIPNEMLKDVDTSDWAIPSVIMKKQIALSGDYTFTIDNENKFQLITDERFTTMRNDGGSYESTYYQIDLENKVVIKRHESYNAPYGKKTDTIVFAKKIDDKLVKELKTSLINLANSYDSGKNENYSYYTLSTLNFSKNYYDEATINNAKKIISRLE
ncbi:MAG: hypothetical protein IKQ29_01075 [Bacilli bacterium]|nr:hypothetical protein [Bacilli bacterium]